jgi:hypothetical protein
MHHIKDTRQHIEIAVNYQFDTKYARNLVKCYLFKELIRNDKGDQLSNHEIGMMIGCDRKKVADYLFHMKVYHRTHENPFLAKDFKPKFEAVKKACENHNEMVNVKQYAAILDRSLQRIKKAFPYNFANYPN